MKSLQQCRVSFKYDQKFVYSQIWGISDASGEIQIVKAE